MKSALRSVPAAVLGAGFLLFSQVVVAAVAGYAQDSQQAVFTNSYGECWRAPGMPVGKPVLECEGYEDSDGDGVPDERDECADTAQGLEVDATGCPLDTDQDGVPDYRDKCPQTISRCPVDDQGCATGGDSDNDADGVPDCIDRCGSSPKGVKVDNQGCELVEDRVLTGVGGPNFKFDSAELTDKAKLWLDERVREYKRAIQNNRLAEIKIIGHTDSRGDPAYNQALSERRANAVGRYLVDNGIPERLVFVQGKGESQPVASNDTEEGRNANRRVEIDVTTTSW